MSNTFILWDDDGIDNVTLRLWKFSDFCSMHTVGVAGDDIMCHNLVEHLRMIGHVIHIRKYHIGYIVS